MALMKPFRVEAQLLRGVSIEPYGLDLAGILASRIWRMKKERILDQQIANYQDSMKANPQDLDLPLDICSTGEDFHWLATCAHFAVDDKQPQHPRTYYKVVNDSWASRASNRPIPYYHPRSGAYRDVMMPAQITLTGKLVWYGVGDISRVQELLAPIRFIGKRRAKGEGRVLKWIVTQENPENSWVHGHIGETNTILRPIPVECADRLGIQYDVDWFAIRPPSWNPDRLFKLAIQKEEEVYLPEEWEL